MRFFYVRISECKSELRLSKMSFVFVLTRRQQPQQKSAFLIAFLIHQPRSPASRMAPANDATLTVNEMFSVGLIDSVRGSGCHLKSDHQSVLSDRLVPM